MIALGFATVSFPSQLAEFAMKTFVPQIQGAKKQLVKLSMEL